MAGFVVLRVSRARDALLVDQAEQPPFWWRLVASRGVPRGLREVLGALRARSSVAWLACRLPGERPTTAERTMALGIGLLAELACVALAGAFNAAAGGARHDELPSQRGLPAPVVSVFAPVVALGVAAGALAVTLARTALRWGARRPTLSAQLASGGSHSSADRAHGQGAAGAAREAAMERCDASDARSATPSTQKEQTSPAPERRPRLSISAISPDTPGSLSLIHI